MLRNLQIVLAALLAVFYLLSALSRRFPDVGWLQSFRFEFPRLSEEQRARRARRANLMAGIELILMGVALPLLYMVSTVMFFSDVTVTGLLLSLAGSFLLIGLGIAALVAAQIPPDR